MSLVITRKLGETVEVQTPSGPVKFSLVQIKGKQVRVAVHCNQEWEINRIDKMGAVEKKYTDWKPMDEPKGLVYTKRTDYRRYGKMEGEAFHIFSSHELAPKIQKLLEAGITPKIVDGTLLMKEGDPVEADVTIGNYELHAKFNTKRDNQDFITRKFMKFYVKEKK